MLQAKLSSLKDKIEKQRAELAKDEIKNTINSEENAEENIEENKLKVEESKTKEDE